MFGEPAGERSAGLSRLIADRGLAAVVASSYEALCYFAGTDIRSQLLIAERMAFLIASAAGDRRLLVCNIERSQALDQSWLTDVAEYVEFEQDPAEALAEQLRGLGITSGTIGVEQNRLPLSVATTLGAQLPGLGLVGVDAALARLQIVKNDHEVERLGRLAQDLLDGLDSTLEALGGSADESAYSAELFSRVSATGATPLFLFFSGGERTVLGHPEAQHRPMDDGSIWRTDFGARLPGGFCGDVARTGVVGTASSEQVEIFAALRSAQDAIIAHAEPGRPAAELFRAAEREFSRNSLPFLMPHVGHGIGVGLHEAPLLEPRNLSPLAVGTVMMIEPFAILADRKEGYHTEDMVVVTAEGPRRLTVPQDELIALA